MKYEQYTPVASVHFVPIDTTEEDKDDYVKESMGAFGLWQFIFILIASLTRSITVWNTMSIVFLAPETDFVCTKFSDNTTVEVTNNTCYETCIEYEYSSHIFDETIISEFGLICKNTWLRSLAQTVMMLGVLCGVTLFGWFSDRFGRSKALIVSGIICTFFMLVTPFCPNFWTFAIARLFAGVGTGGYFTLTSVYMSELVGSKVVDIVLCSFMNAFDGAGLSVLAAFAYWTSTWRTFMMVSSRVTAFIVCLTLFLPETPRWLITKGKKSEAIKLMTNAAKFNKFGTFNISENVTKATEKLNNNKKKNKNLTYRDLFKTKKLAVRTIASFALWFCSGFSYYGLMQHTSYFGSNLYMLIIVLGVVQMFNSLLSMAFVKLCKRRLSTICLYTTIGTLSLVLVFITKGSIAAVVLGSLGAISAGVTFSLIYIIVIEMYPTVMRNMGLSSSSIGSKVGAMIAPFVVNIGTPWISSLIFSAIGFSAVIFCFLLPETKGQKLKDTIEDLK